MWHNSKIVGRAKKFKHKTEGPIHYNCLLLCT